MNAHKFVAEHGVDEAKRVLEGAPDWAYYYSTIDGEYYLIELDAVNLKKLKQIIDLVEIVECGLRELKEKMFSSKKTLDDVKNWIFNVNENLLTEKGILLKRAITDYELVKSYKVKEND